MKEQMEVAAIRLANIVLTQTDWNSAARNLAEQILESSAPVEFPVQAVNGLRPAKQQRVDVHIRWMMRPDMPEVLEIENQAFEFPWSEDDFIRCLRQRNCIGMVAEFEERVVGFMIYELHKTFLSIINFAVHPDYRGKDVGRQMVNKLTSKLSQTRRNRILVDVRESNLAALQFFKAVGFLAVAIQRNSYEDTDEDAISMQFLYEQMAAQLGSTG